MTQEEKARRYDEVLKRAKTYWETDIDNTMKLYAKGTMEYLFPELRESDDEKIRKEIISFVRNDGWRFIKLTKEEKESWIAWLEKQNEKYTDKTDVRVKAHQIAWETSKHYDPSLSKESWCEMAALDMASWFEKQDEKPQGKSALEAIKEERVDNQNCVKPTDKAEPKFKVGEWVVRGDTIAQILDIQEQYYVGLDINGKDFTSSRFLNENKIHLWTIKDAKKGDVLVHNGCTFIFMGIENGIVQAIEENLLNGKTCNFGESDKDNDYSPATKEQRDLFFQKMKEAGYGWNAEELRLDKVEPKFHEGDWTVSKLDRKARQISEVHFDEYNSYYVVNGKDVNLEEYDRLHHLWTIKDARDGDVLQLGGVTAIFKEYIGYGNCKCYCSVFGGEFEIPSQDGGDNSYGCIGATPATKEQRDKLEKAMADAGYEFDFDKKELKKTEQTPAWSEEDEKIYNRIYDIVHSAAFSNCKVDEDGKEHGEYAKMADWLKSLKDRIQPQNTWKPSEKQMNALDSTLQYSQVSHNSFEYLNSLFNDLKKLKG